MNQASIPPRAGPPHAGPPKHPGCGTGRDVWLFRHGQVTEAWQGRIYGALDVPLSELGDQASRSVAHAFREVAFERIVTSSLQRARTLAEYLAQSTGAPLEVTQQLREIERGEWIGKSFDQLRAEAPEQLDAFLNHSWTWNEYGGESDGDVWARAWPAFEQAVRAGRGPLAIVAHRNVIRILTAAALGVAPADSFRMQIDLTHATLLRDRPHGWIRTRSNVCRP